MTEQTKFESWCVIELFGHQKIAGLVTESSIGGTSLLRVDVPEVDGQPAYTKYFGQGAIYSITPTTEDIVRKVLERYAPDPMPYVPRALSAASVDPAESNDDDFDDEDDLDFRDTEL